MKIVNTGDGLHLYEFAPTFAAKVKTLSRTGWNSPESLVAWLETPEATSAAWTTEGRENHGIPSFYGATYRQACTMARDGWQDGVARVARLRDKINAARPVQSRMVAYGVAGAVPNIARYLAGNPAHMRRVVPAEAKRKPVITIVSHIGALADIEAGSFERRAAVTAALVDAIEAAGYSCNVLAYAFSITNDKGAETLVQLKEAGAAVDVARLAFGLGHPAMFRRLVFAVRASRPEFKGGGIGSTVYDGYTMTAPNAYLLPAIQAMGESKFASDNAAIAHGLPAMIAALRAQGCPAFPQPEAA